MPRKTIIKKVLILEDEVALAKLYADKLLEEGFNVKVFHTTDGLEKGCKVFQPEVVFVDHTLDGSDLNGTEAIALIRKCVPKAKIIMLTNYSAFQLKDGATKAGADDYLLKINTPPDVLVSYVMASTPYIGQVLCKDSII